MWSEAQQGETVGGAAPRWSGLRLASPASSGTKLPLSQPNEVIKEITAGVMEEWQRGVFLRASSDLARD